MRQLGAKHLTVSSSEHKHRGAEVPWRVRVLLTVIERCGDEMFL